MLAQVPVLFGLRPATVEHSACQVDGAPECAYTVTWREGRRRRRLRRPAAPPADAPDRPTPVGSHTRMAEEWLGGLQEAVTDLVSDVPLEETLDRIAGHAERAVHAPGYVLDVLLPHGERHVRSRGVGTAVLAALGATRLQPGEQLIGGAPVLAVPVASATRRYGALAVIGQPGQAFFADDVAMLAAGPRQSR